MKFLCTMFMSIFLLFVFFAKIEWHNRTPNILERIIASFVASILFTVMFGLPLLGIISLFN